MTEREKRVAILQAQAGIRSVLDLHRRVQELHPELEVNAATIHRYLYNPPRRLDARVVFAIAEAWSVDPLEAKAALERESSTAR